MALAPLNPKQPTNLRENTSRAGVQNCRARLPQRHWNTLPTECRPMPEVITATEPKQIIYHHFITLAEIPTRDLWIRSPTPSLQPRCPGARP
ncbi:hypothetical protein AVEN_79498-1 [Araneus ventricosus]|uniref:Uncharacterized protein n=1 Tax=Araneus ventricosus TaxID=182803 RepID=A0A4Y2L044_ARAVE|nr:hypothetical protein AVEN_79498-1 [Araneus ventricosus]